ncbi:MAG TPA: hypothetical protein VHX38_38935 [Pseudonocardiaceae bacterium]|nr:hypothetical protein [Pseudonocardiaceae bacterium]
MDGRELVRRLALRWPLVGIGLLLAVIIGGVVFAVTPASYTAQAGVLILPPSTDPGDGTTAVNPLTSLDSGVVEVASTLVYAAGSQQALDTISDASNGGSATVVNTTDDPTNDTPFIQITSTGDSAPEATSAAQAAIGVLGSRLSAIQAGSNVPRSLMMRLTVIVAPVAATASTSGLLKAGGLAAAIVFVLALLVIGLLDRFLPADLGAALRSFGGRLRTALRRPRSAEPARAPEAKVEQLKVEPAPVEETEPVDTDTDTDMDVDTDADVAVSAGASARSAVGGD